MVSRVWSIFAAVALAMPYSGAASAAIWHNGEFITYSHGNWYRPITRNDHADATRKVGIWQKDMRIIAEFAREFDCPTPLLTTTSPISDAAMGQGFAEFDTASVCAVLGETGGEEQSS